MTTASISAPSTRENTWLNQDCEQRLLTLEKLDPKESSTADFLLKVALEDDFEKVRSSAISRIVDLEALAKLKTAGGKAKEAAQQQSCQIIAGTVDSAHSEEERTERLARLPVAGVKQVALITKTKSIGTLAASAVKQNEELADLCLFAASVHVRKSAALLIEDTQLLKEIYSKVAGKDKTVTKTIASRLEQESTSKSEEKPATPAVASGEAPATTTPKEAEPKPIKDKEPEPPLVEPKIEFDAVEKEASMVSYKNTTRLFEIRSQLRKLQARLTDAEIELRGNIETLQADIASKIVKNDEYQNELKAKTEELLVSLAEALESGNSENAGKYWDKIQGNISNTQNQIRAELQKTANTHKEKVTELRNWKVFAATEKKKELIVQMRHLLESKMHVSDRSKSISKMHQEWKALGHSNQNEQLWKEFKKISDQAYEPCKEHFKQRKQLMNDNLLKRREICDALEAEHGRLKDSEAELDLSGLNKLLNEADKNWKLHAPIEQRKIKALQKRYYATVNELRKLRRSEISNSAKQKQELIKKAQELTTQEDNKLAMDEAKRLQQQWKTIGPTTYKEDNKYWQDFRAACDTIFSKRSQAGNEIKQDLKKIEARLNQILSDLEGISKKSDAEFRESKAAYQDLAQEFSNSLDPRIKSQRKSLLDRFNSTKRLIDSRFRALPDKRQQATQQVILDKTERLRALENALLKEDDSGKFTALQQAFDKDSWNEIGKSGNVEADDVLHARYNSVASAASMTELMQLCKKCEDEFRELCIQAEIRANIDSPAEDKALRMKLQLEQLQSGFGQAKPDPKQNLKYAMATEFRSSAMGPIADATRKQFKDRLGQVLQKLR
jgi:hypothetical protein